MVRRGHVLTESIHRVWPEDRTVESPKCTLRSYTEPGAYWYGKSFPRSHRDRLPSSTSTTLSRSLNSKNSEKAFTKTTERHFQV